MRPIACPTCGCTCGGLVGGDISDRRVSHQESLQAQRQVSLPAQSPHSSRAQFKNSVLGSPDQQDRNPVMKMIPNDQQSSFPPGDEEEYCSMKSLMIKHPSTSKSVTHHNPPLLSHFSTPSSSSPPPPSLPSHFSTPPPSSAADTALQTLVQSLSSPNVSIDTKMKSLASIALAINPGQTQRYISYFHPGTWWLGSSACWSSSGTMPPTSGARCWCWHYNCSTSASVSLERC